jgi:hypothetical protein
MKTVPPEPADTPPLPLARIVPLLVKLPLKERITAPPPDAPDPPEPILLGAVVESYGEQEVNP